MTKNLTVGQVENPKPPKGWNGNPKRDRYELADGGGLFLVVQPSGAKSWAYRYRHYGKPRKLTLGPYPLIPLADKRDTNPRKKHGNIPL